MRGIDDVELNGAGLRVGLVVARWNPIICEALLEGAVNTLKEKGVKEEDIIVERVAGAYEIPAAVSDICCT